MAQVDLATLADAGAFVSHEHQAHLAEAVGIAGWSIDAPAAAFVFTDKGGTEHTVRAHFIGTSSPDDGTWLWAWNNINAFPRAFVKQSERVRALGERYAIPEFTTATLPLDDALPSTLLRAVKAVTGITAHFSAPTGNGDTRAWLLLDDPALALPPATVARAVAVVTSALAGVGGPVDQRRALTAWTELRGVGQVALEDDVEQLILTDGSLQVRFDAAGRIAGLGKRQRTAVAATPAVLAEEPVEEHEPEPEPSALDAIAAEAARPAEDDPAPRRGLLQRLLGL